MGGYNGDYSVAGGHFFYESKLFWSYLQQQNSPAVDSMLNTAFFAASTALRRQMQATFRNGSPFGQFRVKEFPTPKKTTFSINGGDGSTSDTLHTGPQTAIVASGPARFWLGGMQALLPATRNYHDPNIAGNPAIHSTVTAVSKNTITDTSAFFNYGTSPVGYYVVVNIDDTGGKLSGTPGHARAFEITGATQTTLSVDISKYYVLDVAGDAYELVDPADPAITSLEEVTAVGRNYRIAVDIVPAGSRTDSIVLDCYLDELDATEDPILNRPVMGQTITSANMVVVRQRIEYLHDYNVAGFGHHYLTLTDVDGNVHHRALLATVTRVPSTTAIKTATATVNTTLYHDNTIWGLTVGSLPTKTSGSVVDGTPGTNSSGTNDTPGSYGGSTLEFPNLLLQSLGNVSAAMNEAVQNMGDYESGGAQKGIPGIGATSATALTSGRHVLLGTNDEQAAIIPHVGTDNKPGVANPFQTLIGHRGLGQDHASNAPAGTLAEHGIYSSSGGETGDTSVSGIDILRQTGGNTAGNFYAKSVPPAPIVISLREYETANAPNDLEERWLDTRIDISAYGSTANFKAAYTVFPVLLTRCAIQGQGAGHIEAVPTGDNTAQLGISSDNHLLLRVRLHKSSDSESFHFSMFLLCLAKGN